MVVSSSDVFNVIQALQATTSNNKHLRSKTKPPGQQQKTLGHQQAPQVTTNKYLKPQPAITSTSVHQQSPHTNNRAPQDTNKAPRPTTEGTEVLVLDHTVKTHTENGS
ncbi:hypothetical protein ACFE04_005405 [Oxalis oulophora]